MFSITLISVQFCSNLIFYAMISKEFGNFSALLSGTCGHLLNELLSTHERLRHSHALRIVCFKLVSYIVKSFKYGFGLETFIYFTLLYEGITIILLGRNVIYYIDSAIFGFN
jgi:hypothetical protein